MRPVPSRLLPRAGAAFAAAALGVLAATGCATPPAGRARDAHLLWSGDPDARAISEWTQGGPFYERVRAASGAERTSWRPFVHTRIDAAEPGVSHSEWFWPLYARENRGDESAWRFLVFFGMDKDAADASSPQDRTWLFPLWFSGTAKDGSDYAALFPLGGTVRELYWDRISFALFPAWCAWERNGNRTWSVLWPLVQRQTGPRRDAWRFLPFWGRSRFEGHYEAEFVLWPVWTRARHFGVNPGSDWMLWPLAGRVDRANESAWLAIPPLFHVARGRGKTPEYRKVNAPWPLIMVRDDKDGHLRRVFPFWSHRWTENGRHETRTVLWPFWNDRRDEHENRLLREWTFFPVFHRSTLTHAPEGGGNPALDEDYLRVWPLWSRRTDPARRFVRIPDFSFRKREGALERNLLGMLTLYTRGEDVRDPDGGRLGRTVHQALWGALCRGRGGDADHPYSFLRVWPLWCARTEDGASEWSLLGGLLGRSSAPGGASAWRWLWLFGGDAAEPAAAEPAAADVPSGTEPTGPAPAAPQP